MHKFFSSKIYLAVLLTVTMLLSGVFGYRYIAGFTWTEALYMTIITVTTVGFSEVRPLDSDAKIFTIVLIISSVFIFAYAILLVTQYFLSRNSLEILKKKKVKKRSTNYPSM